MRILVTGASGFVGRHIVERLGKSNDIVAPTRRPLPSGLRARPIAIDRIDGRTDWREALAGVDAVVHAAGAAHRRRGEPEKPGESYDEVNARGTLAFAQAAAEAGVREFVFVSSIAVNGRKTEGRPPFTEDGPTDSGSEYAASKLRAEQGLAELSARTGLGVTIVRPPQIYGRPATGHIAFLVDVMGRGLPLPRPSFDNRRAFVAVDTLVDFIALRLARPAGGCETFIVADDGHVSSAAFIVGLGRAVGLRPRLVPIPAGVVKAGMRLAGRGAMVESLFASLEVDLSRARATGWTPRSGTLEGLARTFATGTGPTA